MADNRTGGSVAGMDARSLGFTLVKSVGPEAGAALGGSRPSARAGDVNPKTRQPVAQANIGKPSPGALTAAAVSASRGAREASEDSSPSHHEASAPLRKPASKVR